MILWYQHENVPFMSKDILRVSQRERQGCHPLKTVLDEWISLRPHPFPVANLN